MSFNKVSRRRHYSYAYDKAEELNEANKDSILLLLVTTLILSLLWIPFRKKYPIDLSDLWWKHQPVLKSLLAGWPTYLIFTVAFAIGELFGIGKQLMIPANKAEATAIYWVYLRLSARSGVFEELIYRWLFFVDAMAMLYYLNFGHLLERVFVKLLLPVVDFATAHLIHTELWSGKWYLGGAIIACSASFRKLHRYQGVFGMVSSWYISMFLFWMLFHYGLLACIFAHTMYDILIMTTVYLKNLQQLRSCRH